MKQTLLIQIHHGDFDISDPKHEQACILAWKAIRSGLAEYGSRCDYDEGNQERRACFLIDKLKFVSLLAKLPYMPPEIAIAVYTLAEPKDQLAELSSFDEALEPSNYHLKLE